MEAQENDVSRPAVVPEAAEHDQSNESGQFDTKKMPSPSRPPTTVQDCPAGFKLGRAADSAESSSDSHNEGTSSHSSVPAASEPEPPRQDTQQETNRSRSSTKSSSFIGVRRLSATKIQELTAAPGSLPIATIPDRLVLQGPLTASIFESKSRGSMSEQIRRIPSAVLMDQTDQLQSDGTNPRVLHHGRPNTSSRTLSTPPSSRRRSSGGLSADKPKATRFRRNSFQPSHRPARLDLDGKSNFQSTDSSVPAKNEARDVPPAQPKAPNIPLPPMSIPTLLQLELAAQRPSPLYIYQSYEGEVLYESSAVKFERLKNFLVLPAYLERTMNFGALACLDAWLWTFTILPMRFCIAVGILVRWWAYVVAREASWLTGYTWYGLWRLWQRGRRGRSTSRTVGQDSVASKTEESRSRSRRRDQSNSKSSTSQTSGYTVEMGHEQPRRRSDSRRIDNSAGVGGTSGPQRSQYKSTSGASRHRRKDSVPSKLTSFHKADLIQMAVIVFSSLALLRLDASRMYHFIRAQSQIKLYVIFNLLEVGDRLLSALGQDIFECLFSAETLSRNNSGRSKIVLPFGMFLLTLVYNIFHAGVLFYQVITLNVAINSYSHQLLSLLMSNQFVEVKSAVFKRFEKENSFQLTCADMVERFQLWIMLLIIGLRNVVEVGGLSVPGAGIELGDEDAASTTPLHTSANLPASFTILPSWLWSGEIRVLSPFLIVIASEMFVDWIKHAFINKFNNIRPNFYSRILDILCKDYYTNAFVTPSLTRRLGLPLLPLSCLFIRATVQTYHMFLVTRVPGPSPPVTQTSLSVESSSTPSPVIVAGLDRLDNLIRNALGRAVYGYPYAGEPGTSENGTAIPGHALPHRFLGWTSDDVIAALTMVVFFLMIFLVLLVVKLLLGMVLLRYARDRYARMRAREHAVATGKAERDVYDAQGKRVGGFGQVEVGEDRRRSIYADDPEGLRKLREKEKRAAERDAAKDKDKDLGSVTRYEMVAKRIW